MMKKEGYEPIPDVDIEKGIGSNAETEEDLAKKYPEANDVERKFLSKLDNAMKVKPEVSLPKVKAGDFGPPQSIADFIVAIKYPSAALVVTVTSALYLAFVDSPLVISLFPYYCCILTYLSSVPATKGELDNKANGFFSKVEGNKVQAEKRLEGVTETGIGFIDTARNAMEVAIKPIKKTLDAATELETMLRKVDPTIDIPDTSDIEEAFNGISDKVAVIPTLCKRAVDVSRKIPRPLQSKENFDKLVIYPLLAIFLVLQLIGVWQMQHLKIDTSSITNTTETSTTSAMLAVTLGRGEEEGGGGYRFLLEYEEAPDTGAEGTEDVLISNAIASYIGIVIQIIITFIMAQVGVVVSLVNGIVSKVENSLNQALEEKAGPIFRVVFEDGFGEIKRKMLELIHKMEKIEGPMEKVRSLQEKMKMMDVASNLPIAVPNVMPGNVVDDVKASAGQMLQMDVASNLPSAVPNINPGNAADDVKASAGKMFKKFGR